MRRSALVLIAAALLLVRVPVHADDLALDLFSRYLEALARETGIPGLSAAVVGENSILWERSFGMADVERSIAVRPDTPFHLDGLTQTFTAVITLRCAEENRFSLDWPVSHWDADNDYAGMAVRQLLNHTISSPQGSQFSYEPARLAPLWRGIRLCTIDSYRKTLTNLLNRLAMRDSVPGPNAINLPPGAEGLFPPEEVERYRAILERAAMPYSVDRRGRPTRSAYAATELTTYTGLIASVRDLAEFDLALRKGVLLRGETLSTAWQNPVGRGDQPLPHGLGWFAQYYNGELVVWQFGAGENASSSLIVSVPGRRITFIALANSDGLVKSFRLAQGDVTVSPMARVFLRMFVG